MSDVLKVAVTGVIAAICAITVRKQAPELALLLTIAAGVLIVLFCSGALATVVKFAGELAEIGGVSPELFEPVLKVTGIALITRLSAEFCKDAKEGALASAVEAGGTVLALLCALPLLTAVLELLRELLM